MTGTDLLEARVAREQAWIYEAHLAGHTKPHIRALALAAPEDGGLGRTISFAEIRAAIEAVRQSNGSIIGTKEERVEKASLLLDEQIELALAARRIAAAESRIDYDAEKLLVTALDRKAKLHGDDAAQRIEADITTRDAVAEELNAMLARAGRDPIPIE
jgi:hypothetical protein